MGHRLDNAIRTNGGVYVGGGTSYLVQTPEGVLYFVYIDNQADISFRKSTDAGLSWSLPTVVSSAIAASQIAIWYDKWSGLAGGKIHVAYSDATSDDTFYRSIDTASSDALSSEVTIFTGASTLAGNAISITATRSGYLYVLVCIDAGSESEFLRSTDGGATWDATLNATGSFESASGDQWILLPAWNADTNDLMCIFWDASVNEISRKLYDSSANSWSETSISGSMNDVLVGNGSPNFAATVDLTNSQNILIAWNDNDLANADLKCWTVTDSAITAKTDVITNSTDDQSLCGLAINTVTGYWYAFYCGKTDGSETVYTALNTYYRVSEDAGTTWGSEISLETRTTEIRWMGTAPRFFGPPLVAYFDAVANETHLNTGGLRPRATMMIGV